MKIILDELTPRDFFSNGGVVRIELKTDELKKFHKRSKFFFYEYRSYIRFLRETYLNYMSAHKELSSRDVQKSVNDAMEIRCNIGTKEYTVDPKFDGTLSLDFCNFYYCYDNDVFSRMNGRNRIDVYGVPNVNFSVINQDDERWEKFEEQRLERGFDDSELWELYMTITKFILPRLILFKKKHYSEPSGMVFEQWNDILDEMIEAFELIEKGECEDVEKKKIEKGLRTFAKYFTKLWD